MHSHSDSEFKDCFRKGGEKAWATVKPEGGLENLESL
jgi:hypothetical protein